MFCFKPVQCARVISWPIKALDRCGQVLSFGPWAGGWRRNGDGWPLMRADRVSLRRTADSTARCHILWRSADAAEQRRLWNIPNIIYICDDFPALWAWIWFAWILIRLWFWIKSREAFFFFYLALKFYFTSHFATFWKNLLCLIISTNWWVWCNIDAF